MINNNIRTRLSFQFTLIVISILVLFSVSIYYFSSSYRQLAFYRRVKNKALTNARLLIQIKAVDKNLLKIIDRNTINALFNEKVAIYNYLNKQIYNSLDIDSIEISKELLDRIRLEKEIYYVEGEYEVVGLLYTDRYDRFVVIASAYDKYGKSELSYLRWILIAGFIVSTTITIIAGRVYATRALKPMSDVVKQVDKITVSNLHHRVSEGNGTDEIAQLAITFNKMLQRLESAFEMQRSFVSNSSHELRTPLTSITGQLEVTLLNKRTVEEYETVLWSVLDDIKNLNALTNGLLDLAKVSSDISEVKFTSIRIDELLLEIQSTMLKRKPGCRISISFDEQVDDENKLMVYANESLLKTALLNIIDNACKYSSDSHCQVLIQIMTDYIAIEFKDVGIGIDEKELKSILEPFYRASNAKNFYGHGLGLSLTDKIISLHKGTLKIKSEFDKGTIVSVILFNQDT
ncbi:MAG: HAMP domain-containing sensor histidine kinase [Bacteroidia bacterium]